jgi:hypothetical protein
MGLRKRPDDIAPNSCRVSQVKSSDNLILKTLNKAHLHCLTTWRSQGWQLRSFCREAHNIAKATALLRR